MSSEPRLEVRELSLAWGRAPVLRSVDLTVSDGEFVVLMGPNGSGKTTLLRTIAGFERPSSGRVLLRGEEVTEVPAHRRGIGILFQDATLFPGRSVWENIAYGLEVARRPGPEVSERVAAMVDLLGLHGLEDRAPEALSGGERQRVALARTLAPGPSLVLLDEPFASIDPERRAGLRAEFRSALRRLGVSAVHVTHDRDEGLFLGDRIVLLIDGRVVQSGTPTELLGAPASEGAARFLGFNVLEEDGRRIAVDPHDVSAHPQAPGLPAEVEAVGPTTDGFVAVFRIASGQRIQATGPGGAPRWPTGKTVFLRWRNARSLA